MAETTPAPAKGKIIISYNVLGIGFIILIAAITILAFVDYKSTWNIELREYVALGAFGAVTIGLIYNASTLHYNYLLNEKKFEREDTELAKNKIKVTYDIMSDWHKADMAMNAERTRRFMQPFKGRLNDPAVLKEFNDTLALPENVESRKSLTSVLNYFEMLSLLVDDDVIDEGILRKTFRTAFITYYSNLKEYIIDEQRGNDGQNAKIFINFVRIATKWAAN